MNSAPEPTPFDVSDDLSTKAQTRRSKLNMLAIAACLIGLAVPYPHQWLDGSMDSSTFCHTAIKPKERNPDEPLCLLDADDLPDADVLVRASQEPDQAQRDILLRAVGAAQEQHSEQLLRAAGGQE